MTDNRFSPFAREILKQRYLGKNESPADMFHRVAKWISQPEKENSRKWEETFFNMMNNLDFLPNSPCLMNAGTSVPQLAACFVFPVQDSMESIFDTLKHSALTHKSGGGTGFSFSRLRPRGDRVSSTGGITSGPVSFIEVYDKATEAIRQGGKRRGANMGILRVDHPDIDEFIEAKKHEHKLNNFNISVSVPDEFMRALFENKDYNLYFPPGGEVRDRRSSKRIFDKIARGAWQNGEPGVLFIDKINEKNPLKKLGHIEATNPCGEQPLLPYEACILGSINLANHVKGKSFDFKKLEKTVRTSVRFLDNAIDVSEYPLKQIQEIVKANRKTGLGVMGFASALMKISVPYASARALKTAKKIMRFIRDTAHSESEKLAGEKSPFPNFYHSNLKIKRRNALVTTIAPTGTISIIAGVSSGIEPLYSLIYERQTAEGKVFRVLDEVFKEEVKKRGLSEKQISEDVLEKGGIKNLEYIDEEIRNIFLTATEISPRIHVLMQAAFQAYTDNAISKTVNLPENYTVKAVGDIIKRAYRLGCKGITVYRQHSRQQQVMDIVCECDK